MKKIIRYASPAAGQIKLLRLTAFSFTLLSLSGLLACTK